MDTAIIVAVVGAVAAAIGGIASHVLLRWRENETRRLQLIRDHAVQQISEFYAPLSALTEQLDTTATICDDIQGPDRESPELARLIYADSFGPVHEEILAILKNKVHLAEGRQVPKSFIDYLRHYRAQRTQVMLDKAGLSVTVKDPGFPSDFYYDVREGLNSVSARYEDTIDQLGTPFLPVMRKNSPTPPVAAQAADTPRGEIARKPPNVAT